ncbi:hypothetical protein EMPS_11141 [Entomortierella parvispora]|uniref:Ubiquitin-like domain-containing protein n=1 Tax=Entomortierella parvispora TaxID=205924 RepID=A0A9P3HMC8_9FUNG|nr:hypothetical protein EMPS_11141 [Entomortierella parvispora]
MKVVISTGPDASDRFELHHNDDGKVSFSISEDAASQEVTVSVQSSKSGTTMTVKGPALNISVEPAASSAEALQTPPPLYAGNPPATTGVKRQAEEPLEKSETAPFFIFMEMLLEDKTSRAFKLKISPSTGVSNLKCMVQDRQGIPPDQVRLIHEGKQMDDDRLLSDYGVKAGSVVYIVMMMRGS